MGKFDLKLDKEQLKGLGKIAWKIGKRIVLDGTASLIVKGAKVTVETVFTGQSIKSIQLDEVLSGKRLDHGKHYLKENWVFTGEEIVDPSNGDVYRKVSSFELESMNELNREIDVD